MKDSELEWVKPISNIIGVNSLRLGGLNIIFFHLYVFNNDAIEGEFLNKRVSTDFEKLRV